MKAPKSTHVRISKDHADRVRRAARKAKPKSTMQYIVEEALDHYLRVAEESEDYRARQKS